MEQLFKQFRVETFRKDTVLYKENDVSSCLYFIRDGEVEVFLKNSRFLRIF